jgi:hypothetical protein
MHRLVEVQRGQQMNEPLVRSADRILDGLAYEREEDARAYASPAATTRYGKGATYGRDSSP